MKLGKKNEEIVEKLFKNIENTSHELKKKFLMDNSKNFQGLIFERIYEKLYGHFKQFWRNTAEESRRNLGNIWSARENLSKGALERNLALMGARIPMIALRNCAQNRYKPR